MRGAESKAERESDNKDAIATSVKLPLLPHFDDPIPFLPMPPPFWTCVNAPSANHFAFASSTLLRIFDGSTSSRPAGSGGQPVARFELARLEAHLGQA